MTGTLRLAIGGNNQPPLVLEYDLLVDAVPGGLRLHDSETDDTAMLWDIELKAVAHVGDGPTPLTAYMLAHLIDQAFWPAN